MSVTIKPAVLRDASFITANLSAIDHHEAFCQLPLGTPSIVLAHWLIYSGDAFIAYIDDEPVTLYGTSPINATCFSVWAVGTDRMKRTIPAVTRHLMTEHIEKRITQDGARTMEARSLVEHHAAHAWMKSVGAEQLGEPFEYGRDGELFVLFRFTVARYRAMRDERWSKPA